MKVHRPVSMRIASAYKCILAQGGCLIREVSTIDSTFKKRNHFSYFWKVTVWEALHKKMAIQLSKYIFLSQILLNSSHVEMSS